MSTRAALACSPDIAQAQPAGTSWIRIGCRVAILLYVVLIGLLISPYGDQTDTSGRDFITFWAASYLALAGDPASAYEGALISAAGHVGSPSLSRVFLWHYPPTFQVLALPLSLFSYKVSFIGWLAITGLFYLAAIRKLTLDTRLLWLAVAFPAAFINTNAGQNGFLSAALICAAICALETRPVLAGILIGLLAYKPHLGLLFPLALICSRRWTTFFAAAAAVIAFSGLSALILGIEVWRAFIATMGIMGERIDSGALNWSMMPSVYIGLRELGLGSTWAYVVHGAVAFAAVAAVAWAWWQKVPQNLAAAILVSATVLISPYIFTYDLLILAVTMVVLVEDGWKRGWRFGDRAIIALTWLVPAMTVLNLQKYGLPLEPLCLVGLLGVAVRRAWSARRQPHDAV